MKAYPITNSDFGQSYTYDVTMFGGKKLKVQATDAKQARRIARRFGVVRHVKRRTPRKAGE